MDCREASISQKLAVFRMVARALAQFHAHGVVHGSLTPDNILWFATENTVKLSNFSFWGAVRASLPLHPALRYAPPEVCL